MTTSRPKAPAVCVTLALALCLSPPYSGADDFIRHQDWEKVSSAMSVLQIPPLQSVIGSYQSGADMIVVIRYPGGDEGSKWGVELRDWLVAFGIPLGDIELLPGSGMPGAIAINAEPRNTY